MNSNSDELWEQCGGACVQRLLELSCENDDECSGVEDKEVSLYIIFLILFPSLLQDIASNMESLFGDKPMDRFTYKVCGAEECGTIYTYTSDIAYTCGFSCWDYFWSLVWGDTPAPW